MGSDDVTKWDPSDVMELHTIESKHSYGIPQQRMCKKEYGRGILNSFFKKRNLISFARRNNSTFFIRIMSDVLF